MNACAQAVVGSLAVVLLAGCAGTLPPRDEWMPRIVATDDIDVSTLAIDAPELERRRLIAANLVSALVQLPDMRPSAVTLQVSVPTNAWGHVLVRALEDAGYGLQRVSADQGLHYLSYRRRVADTEAGEVVDYGLSIAGLELSREYTVREGRVYPSSLLSLRGTDDAALVRLDDTLFGEQGGNTAFVSGVRGADGRATGDGLVELAVDEFDEVPEALRTAPAAHVEAALLGTVLGVRSGADEAALPNARTHERLRRTVLIFDDASTTLMGARNKQAVRLLVRDFRDGDVFVVTACTDADGRNDAAAARALRVREEFLSFGVPSAAVRTGPCLRASYRHPSDRSPVPVEIVQHRSRQR